MTTRSKAKSTVVLPHAYGSCMSFEEAMTELGAPKKVWLPAVLIEDHEDVYYLLEGHNVALAALALKLPLYLWLIDYDWERDAERTLAEFAGDSNDSLGLEDGHLVNETVQREVGPEERIVVDVVEWHAVPGKLGAPSLFLVDQVWDIQGRRR